MPFKRLAVMAATTVLLLVGAFSLGTAVLADIAGGPPPGSAEDPLVSESYVKAKVAALEARIAELEQQVAGYSSSANSGSSNNSSGNSSSGESSTSQPPGSSSNWKVKIKQLSTYANVRSAPNTKAEVLIKMNPGSELVWLKTSGEWFNVRLSDGRSGWVHNSVAELR